MGPGAWAGRRQRDVGRVVQAGEDDGGQNRVGRAGGAGRVRTERTRDNNKKAHVTNKTGGQKTNERTDE